MSGDGLNSTVPPSPTKAILPHFRVARIAVARAVALAEQSIARSTPKPLRQFLDLSDIVCTCLQNEVTQFERLCQMQALRDDVNADDHLGAEFATQCRSCKPDGPQSGDQHGMVAIDPNFLDRLVNGPKATRNLRAICVGKLAREAR